ncbi:adenine-specific DNA-methyltransferase [Campylobacter upsaliensis]|uniref:adenine-specific DNA-methyltransferase n=1 Tax=Campylobacter upsaliensis TaxID=28080 RepID=UPI0022EB93E9|nr:adenine-specific DNA-methyltransferase [Campylobacter upsaliensis]MEB2804965.1 adenine-specific DNA-methyltransferase [Campylobacter upsaliensis]
MRIEQVKNVFKTLKTIYQHNDNTIALLGDSLKILNDIKSQSIDLIFADPPYGIGKDFGISKDIFANANEYLEWCKVWIDSCMRILKPNGTMYFMSSTQFMPFLDCYVSEKYFVINRIVWTYDSAGVQPKNKFSSSYEPILMITHNKNSPYVFNKSDILVEAKTGAKRKLIDYRKTPPKPYNSFKIPSNVWHFNRVRYKMIEYENHPTQKPESLLKRIILTSSNKDDIVLDPFAGSFTTCKVALDLGRKTIGIDNNEEFFKIGLRRCAITQDYNNENLEKIKIRKTNNKSKKDHLVNQHLFKNIAEDIL